MIGRGPLGFALMPVLILLAVPACAHGLLVSIHGEGGIIFGKVFYSNGDIGAGQYDELTDLDRPGSTPQTGKTAADGSFRFEGIPGHHYRFMTEGEEGHTSEMRITLAEGAKGRFVDHDAVIRPYTPPAWLVIGGLLALISVPVLWVRSRK